MMIFTSIYSYNYGAQNDAELQNVFKKSMTVNTVLGIMLGTAAILLASPLSKLFVFYFRLFVLYSVKRWSCFRNHFVSPHSVISGGSGYDSANVPVARWNLVFHYSGRSRSDAGDILLFSEKEKEI